MLTLGYFLQKNGLGDYVILIAIFVLFVGIFSMSHIQVTARLVKIRKNYFWGLVGCKWDLEFDQITGLTTKHYEIETHDDSFLFTESWFTFLTVDLLRPKVSWLTTKLSYLDNGRERDIELKMTREDYKEIDRRIKRGY